MIGQYAPGEGIPAVTRVLGGVEGGEEIASHCFSGDWKRVAALKENKPAPLDPGPESPCGSVLRQSSN